MGLQVLCIIESHLVLRQSLNHFFIGEITRLKCASALRSGFVCLCFCMFPSDIMNNKPKRKLGTSENSWHLEYLMDLNDSNPI